MPVYVAGFDLGFFPIGFWLMAMTLSMLARPWILSHSPMGVLDLWRFDFAALRRVLMTSVDFPDPDTPVTAVMSPMWNVAVMFFRLFARAPMILI